MVIRGERVFLRPIQASDYPKIVAWSNDPEVAGLLEGDYPRTLEECPAWHRLSEGNRHQQRFAICTHEGVLIGDTELDHIAWRSGDAELRIRIGEKEFWDQGYGTDSVTALLGYAFSSLRLSRVYLRVFHFNKRAIRCYEKCGFRKEGRLSRPGPFGKPAVIYLMRIEKEEFERARASAPRAARPA